MADPAAYRPAAGSIPDGPGVYRFTDDTGRVIYVGKAKSLRSRLSSYFQDITALHPRTRQMVLTAAAVDWTVVSTEVEALQLEYNWIKEFDPRFNVRYRDDKSYPSLAVTLSQEYPRLLVMRGPRRRGVRYFGPYAHAWAIRETLDLLLRVFPARTCSAGVFKRAGQVGRPCLLGYIGKCSAPCVGRVSPEEHREIVEDFCDFMAGQTAPYIKRLEREMAAAAAEQEYERAARLRDDVGALKRAMEKQAVVLADGADADVVGVAQDPLEASVQVFHVRGGRVRGQRGFVVDKVEELSEAGVVEQFLEQFYGGVVQTDRGPDRDGAVQDVPRSVLVPVLPEDPEAVTEWLESRRGGRVELKVPRRGDKKALLETVTRNAAQGFALHKTKRASDLTARSRALAELQEALDLDDAPLRIECYDVSNLQSSNVVASMVVFEDGLARKSEYRRFAVRGIQQSQGSQQSPGSQQGQAVQQSGEGVPSDDDGPGQDDTASLYEVITRRFTRHLQEKDQPAEPLEPDGTPRRFAYPPNLVVVDGGQPQVAAAARALADLGIHDVALCGLAKRLEEVWLPDQSEPVVLSRTSEGLYLLQRVRDEAHRFAISYHRQRRSRTMVASALDDVPGSGETRRKALLRHFGSLKRLRAATPEEIAKVPGVGPQTAQAVAAALLGQAATGSAPAVDPATGEILDAVPS